MTTTPVTRPAASRPQPPRQPWRRGSLLLVAGCVAAATSLLWSGDSASAPTAKAAGERAVVEVPAPELVIGGISDGALLSAADVATAALRVTTNAAWAETLQVTLDGEPVVVTSGAAVVSGGELALLGDGEHTLRAVAGDDDDTTTSEVTFVLDTISPTVELPEIVETRGYDTALAVGVRVTGATAVTAEGARSTSATTAT